MQWGQTPVTCACSPRAGALGFDRLYREEPGEGTIQDFEVLGGELVADQAGERGADDGFGKRIGQSVLELRQMPRGPLDGFRGVFGATNDLLACIMQIAALDGLHDRQERRA